MSRSTYVKTERKRKKNKSAFSCFVMAVLVFALGFFCGGRYFSSEPANVDTVVEDGTVNEETVSDQETNTINEQERLDNLRDTFIAEFYKKYPLAELSFAVKNLDNGVSAVYNNKKMNSASVIKLFILETVYRELAKGAYELTEKKREELSLMITESNNPASNLFIDDFGGENEERHVTADNLINKTIKEMGYEHTELNRKMYDTTPAHGASKYNNYTSVADVCRFLEGIYNKTLLEEPYNTETLELLKAQKRRGKIPAKIVEKYPDVIVANKTGEVSTAENDAALIMGDGFNLAFVVMVDNIPQDSDGDADYELKKEIQETISDFGLSLVELYKSADVSELVNQSPENSMTNGPEETKPEETKPEENMSKENKSEADKSEEVKPEENASEGKKIDNIKPTKEE